MDNALKALTVRQSACSIEEEGRKYRNVIRDATASVKAVSTPTTSAAIERTKSFLCRL
jgi:hypothetical protein